MTISIFLGKIIGLYLLITSIAILFNLKFYKKAIDEAVKSPMLILLASILTLILGIILIISHNIWIVSWHLIITIFAWFVLFKGAFLMMFPNALSNCIKHYKTKYKIDVLDWLKWICIISLFVGIYLIYITFVYVTK